MLEQIQKRFADNIGGLAMVIARIWEKEYRRHLPDHRLTERVFLGKILPKGLELKKDGGLGFPLWLFHIKPALERCGRLADDKWRAVESPIKLPAMSYPLGESARKSWGNDFSIWGKDFSILLNGIGPRKDPGCFPAYDAVPQLYKLTGDLPALEIIVGQKEIEGFLLQDKQIRNLAHLDYLIALRLLAGFVPQRAEFGKCLAEEALKFLQQVREAEKGLRIKSQIIAKKAELAAKGKAYMSGGALVLCDEPVIATWKDREEFAGTVGQVKRVLEKACELGLEEANFSLALPDIPGSTVDVGKFFRTKMAEYKINP